MSVLAAAAALFAAVMVPNPVFAEQPVGLEAQGVNPWAALRNGQNLDVRDALGRPVSAQLINKQLAAASAKAVEEKAVVSRLPKARVIFRLLERLSSLTGFWGLSFPMIPARGVFALPVRTRGVEKALPAVEIFCAAALALFLGCCKTQTASRCPSRTVVALRC